MCKELSRHFIEKKERRKEWLLGYSWTKDHGSSIANIITFIYVQWLFISENFPFLPLTRKTFLPGCNLLSGFRSKEFHLILVVFCHFLIFLLWFCFLAFIQVTIMFSDSWMGSCKALKTISQSLPLGCFKLNSFFLL